MKPESRVEPDAKRTKLNAEPKKEPKMEPKMEPQHDPMDEAPRLDTNTREDRVRDDKNAILEAEKRRRREKEERREKRKKEKKMHEGIVSIFNGQWLSRSTAPYPYGFIQTK